MKNRFNNYLHGAAAITFSSSTNFMEDSECFMVLAQEKAKSKNITLDKAVTSIMRERAFGLCLGAFFLIFCIGASFILIKENYSWFWTMIPLVSMWCFFFFVQVQNKKQLRRIKNKE